MVSRRAAARIERGVREDGRPDGMVFLLTGWGSGWGMPVARGHGWLLAVRKGAAAQDTSHANFLDPGFRAHGPYRIPEHAGYTVNRDRELDGGRSPSIGLPHWPRETSHRSNTRPT